eukprot:g18354.t1
MTTGTKPPMTGADVAPIWVDEKTLQYAQALSEAARSNHAKVLEALPKPKDGTIHPFKPGDFVYIQSLEKGSFSPRWKGPYQVPLTNRTAVKVQGKPDWIHGTHYKA